VPILPEPIIAIFNLLNVLIYYCCYPFDNLDVRAL
jgi:hypothetical protein